MSETRKQEDTDLLIRIAPSQRMELYEKINKEVFDRYKTYAKVALYFEGFFPRMWDGYVREMVVTYSVRPRKVGNETETVIDVEASLVSLPDRKLIQMAIDLGIKVPNVLYTLPNLKW